MASASWAMRSCRRAFKSSSQGFSALLRTEEVSSALSVLPSAAASLLVVASAHGEHPSPGPGSSLQDQG